MWLPASGRVTRRSDRGDNRQLQYEPVFRGYAIKRAFLVAAFRSCRRCARLALVPKRANLALFCGVIAISIGRMACLSLHGRLLALS